MMTLFSSTTRSTIVLEVGWRCSLVCDIKRRALECVNSRLHALLLVFVCKVYFVRKGEIRQMASISRSEKKKAEKR